MKVHCPHDRLVSIDELKSHPRNRNVHPADQIAALAKILEYQGMRYPIKVSKRSGYVTSGHGRIMAAKLLKWTELPVSFQDYDSEEMEYADVQADNAIASWAELDLSGIHKDLPDFEPFDIDLMGIRGFSFEPDPSVGEWDGMPEFEHEDKTAFKTIQLHLQDEAALADFSKLINQPLTEKTRTVWFPPAPIERMMDKEYG